MPYRQSIERALAGQIGEGGIADRAFRDMLKRAEPALATLREAYERRTLALLRLPERSDDLPALAEAAKKLGDASDVVFLGTGGSSLGGQAIAQLADHGVPGLAVFRKGPRAHFLDNLDPATLGAVLAQLPLKSTRFAAISKSGGTAETLMQTMAAIDALKRAGVARPGEHFVGLTMPATSTKRNGLRDLMAGINATVLDHDPEIVGRYSAISNVGLLPALVLGLDAGVIRAGAGAALAPLVEKRPASEVPYALGAALSATAAGEGKNIRVLVAYADRLERFTKWWVQLWAESLGKQGKGATPVAALGPVDQHSQLQLWLAGPRDKLFTVLTVGTAGTGPRIDAALAKTGGEPDFGGRAIGDLVTAEAHATVDSLAKNGRPVRTLHVEKLDERGLGALFMHFMLETIMAAHLLGVDPFGQPAVEEGKVLAKRYLKGG